MAEHFYNVLYDRTGDSWIAREAFPLVETADRLDRALDEGAGSREVQAKFDRLQKDYRYLRNAMDRAERARQDPRVMDAFDGLIDAYRNLDRAMGPDDVDPRHPRR